MIGWLLFAVFILLLFLNVPIAIALAAASIITLLFTTGASSLSLLADIMYASTAKFTLLAIPFFILAGVIMEYSGISKRLIHFANLTVGHLKGGMALVTVFTAIFFSAISGSGPATVAAIGSILIPALVKNGYPKNISSGLLASSGAIGIIIPPSIAFIVFAVVAGDQFPASIGRLFIAGIVPGILIGIGLLIATMFVMWKNIKENSDGKLNVQRKASFIEVIKGFFSAFWGLLVPVIILGGIYRGVFTPTEAAVVAVFYGLFVGFFIHRELNWRDLKNIMVDTSIQTAVVMLIVSSASVFAYIITTEQIAQNISNFLFSLSDSKIIILLTINIILLIAGAFIDAISAYYLFIPILLPIIMKLGVDPTVFAVFMTVNLAIGQFTPPVGINLYVAAGISGISLKDISKGVVPYVIVSILVLMLITYIPAISTWLPNLLGVK